MVKDQKLDYSVLGDPTNAQMCVVFIHGWSGNKDSFRRVAKSFSIRNCAWYLPQAPYLLEKEGGYSWTYEISPGKFEREQPVRMLLDFFDNQIFSKFDSRDVYLFGFSQGGLVCYEMIRVLEKRLGGVFPIGGFMAGTKKQMQRINPQQKKTPIIIGHGDLDEVISADESRLAHSLLSQESSKVTLDIYRGGHKIGLDYLRKAKEFIEKEYE
jgi:phospholipase/carboxylesterase